MKILKQTISRIEKVNTTLQSQTRTRLDNLTKPKGSLGRLEEIAQRVVNITGKHDYMIRNKVIFTMAGDHGVADIGVSAFPKEVTEQMVYNFVRGGAGINVLARHAGAKVVVVDMGVACDLKRTEGVIIKKVAYGTANIADGPAMSREQAVESLENGIEAFEEQYNDEKIDLVGTGEMGIANTTPSSAIVSVLTGLSPDKATGRGTGIDDKVLCRKTEAVKNALRVNSVDVSDGIDVLAKLGGFEIGGLAGVILAAAARKVPVVVDGFISTAAAMIAAVIEPDVKEYMFSAHSSAEPGHKVMLEKLGLDPLLDLKLRLGEGTGAALGMSLIEAAMKILNEMATFDDAGVSNSM